MNPVGVNTGYTRGGKLEDCIVPGVIRNDPGHVLCLQECNAILNPIVQDIFRQGGNTGIALTKGGREALGCFVRTKNRQG